MNYRVIDKTEIEDFHNALRRAGYSSEDFELSEQEEEPRPAAPGGVFYMRGTATVTSKKTGISRTYAAGHGTAWVNTFEENLRARLFEK
jgi:hypothetical protein